jgi:hypothetical protein
MRDLAALTAADFEAVTGSDFAVARPESAGAKLRLAHVVLLSEPPPGQRQPFSLRFRGPAVPAPEQGIHRLTHADLGDLEIFLVPIAADCDSVTYEAVFA